MYKHMFFMCLFVYLFFCLFVCLFVGWLVRLFVCLFIRFFVYVCADNSTTIQYNSKWVFPKGSLRLTQKNISMSMALVIDFEHLK